MKKVLLLTMTVLLGTELDAGSGAHGGGDNRLRPDYFAWFVGSTGEETVTFCISLGRKIGRPDQAIKNPHRLIARIESAVTSSFANWQEYFIRRSSRPTSLQTHLLPVFIGDCRGQVADLKIFVGDFGRENEFSAVQTYRKKFDNPAAFSRLETYSIKKAWGRGVIWFHDGNPYSYYLNEREKQNLYFDRDEVIEILIMHEVGHVLGNGHVEGTIMDEEIVRDLFVTQQNISKEEAKLLTEIDGTRQLLPVASIAGSKSPEIVPVKMSAKDFAERFEGKVKGDVFGHVEWRNGIETEILLKFSHHGQVFVKLIKPQVTKSFPDLQTLFNTCRKEGPLFHTICSGSKRGSFIQIATIDWPTGLKETLMIKHNIPDQTKNLGHGITGRKEQIFSIQSIDPWERRLVRSAYPKERLLNPYP